MGYTLSTAMGRLRFGKQPKVPGAAKKRVTSIFLFRTSESISKLPHLQLNWPLMHKFNDCTDKWVYECMQRHLSKCTACKSHKRAMVNVQESIVNVVKFKCRQGP